MHSNGRRPGVTVLVVDDSPTYRAMAAQVLRTQGIEVLVANAGGTVGSGNLTSAEAGRRAGETGSRASLDSLAACVLLEAYLARRT